MGSGEVKSASHKTWSEIVFDAFPQYLAIGFTEDQFWHGDASMFKYHRKAWKIKTDMEFDRDNMSAWMQGLYVREAVASCLSKTVKYPNEPHNMRNDGLSVEEAAARFRMMADAINEARRKARN